MRVAIFGAGSWGTALAISLANSEHAVTLWARSSDKAQAIRSTRHNPSYVREAHIPESVHVTSDLAEAVDGAQIWVIATPSQSIRELARKLQPYARPDLIVVSVSKGIEDGTLMTMTQVLDEVLTPVPSSNLAVLHGPSHAEEVVVGKPTTIVAAAYDADTVRTVQEIFMSPMLRVYGNRDVVGVEIAGAVKNVLALAAGMSDGVGNGDNAKAAIVTRGIAEIQRLGLALGAEWSTFAGLAGLGDLVVTCMSRHSRNRYFGEQLGKGRSLAEVEAEMNMVAEGVRSTRAVYELAVLHNVDMPITRAVYQILFEGLDPRDAVNELMTRSAKHEDMPVLQAGYIS